VDVIKKAIKHKLASNGMCKLILTIFLIIINLGYIFSQCTIVNNTFKTTECVSYNIYYNVGFLWFNAAEVSFTAKSYYYKNKDAYIFDSYGKTLPNYDWFFKVRDHYQSIVDSATLSPLFFSRDTKEGNYRVNNKYEFNYTNKKVYSVIENSKKPKFLDTLDIQGCCFDPLTAIYACRNFDVSSLGKNDTIPIKMLIDNAYYNIYLRYLGAENTSINDSTLFRCKKFSVLMVAGSIFSGGENITVWISDDKAKIPIKVEAEILVGSIVAKVDKVFGNKWPIESILKTE